VTMSDWASGSRLDVPILAVDQRDHGTIISDPDKGMVERIVSFLGVSDAGAYNTWLQEAQAWSEPAKKKMLQTKGHLFAFWETADLDGWQQFVVHVRDGHGDPVTDYMFEVFELGPDGKTWQRAEEISVDVHPYGADTSYRCFHVQLPKGITTAPKPMQIRIQASTGTDVVTYQGYGTDGQKMEMRADSDPVAIEISEALKDRNATLFHPFTTTLVEVVLNRVPYPFGAISKIFGWMGPFPERPQSSSTDLRCALRRLSLGPLSAI
jgi:hypothetical protein